MTILHCLVFVLFGLFYGAPSCHGNVCDSEIFCTGPLVDAVQKVKIHPDSKHFADMRLKEDQGIVLERFNEMRVSGNLSKQSIETFLQTFFVEPGSETEEWSPSDWRPSPKFLDNIIDPTLRDWAHHIHGLWKTLGRKMKTEVRDYPDRQTLIYLPHPYFIPGSRFREIYYWDTYWIVRGLLVSDMHRSAKDVILNQLYLVKTIGFMPNGGRTYFLNRSQPPLLIAMVKEYFEYTYDIDFLKEVVDTLEKEYKFWMEHKSLILWRDGKQFIVNRYNAELTVPRPESYREDLETVQGLKEDDRIALLSDIATAAESGWDFSSRWIAQSKQHLEFSLRNLDTRDVIPVDLNSIMCMNERLLSEMYIVLGDTEKSIRYAKLYQNRLEGFDKIFWNYDIGAWFDVSIKTNLTNNVFYGSSVVPLFTECFHKADKRIRESGLLAYIKGLGLHHYPGGIPISLINTGQQWDYPNVWPPLVHMTIEGFANSHSAEGREFARNMTEQWLKSNLHGWKETGYMFEKYNADEIGAAGRGGEYDVQIGFGWTNGIILDLLNTYGDVIKLPASREQDSFLRYTTLIVGAIVTMIILGVFFHMTNG